MTGKIENTPGLIKNNTGLINQDTGMINDGTGLIIDTNDAEYTGNRRGKRSRERGKDNKPRKHPLRTMKNLPQFRDKSHEEVRQYILEKKGVDIGSNFNFGSLMLWVFVILAIIPGIIGIGKWLQKRQKKAGDS